MSYGVLITRLCTYRGIRRGADDEMLLSRGPIGSTPSTRSRAQTRRRVVVDQKPQDEEVEEEEAFDIPPPPPVSTS